MKSDLQMESAEGNAEMSKREMRKLDRLVKMIAEQEVRLAPSRMNRSSLPNEKP